MKRREFITLVGGAVAWPLAARAQQAGKVWRIGFLSGASRETFSRLYAGFQQGTPKGAGRFLGESIAFLAGHRGARGSNRSKHASP